MSDDNEAKKIIIDEDWKSQVERERKEVHEQEQQPESDAAGTQKMPEASMAFLISTLSAQVLASLGQFPDPVVGKPIIHLDYAKLNIDTLSILQQKTKGNLEEEEEQLLEQTLHELRMLFVKIETELAKLSAEDLKKMAQGLDLGTAP
jgi:hypothetical protein